MVQGPFDGWNKPESPDRRRFRVLLVILLLLGGGGFVAYRIMRKSEAEGPKGTAGPAGAPAAKTEWSTDDIASDPEGYLKWADNNIATQLKQREEMLEGISGRKNQLETRRNEVAGELTEIETLYARLQTAVRKAEAEDRWPVTVGSRTFDKDKATILLAQLPKQIELRKPLAQDYEDALRSMSDHQAKLQSDIVSLNLLREKIALDVERVRLNRGVDELTKLSKSSQEISSFTGLVGSSSVEAPPAVGGTAGIQDLDSLLK